ncbi:DUF927 domain-containing protein [Xanthobacter sp. DSM 24535]|uniref:DUF927 domain-containing protein n=1 Tax=Roseixanthobacter psychrophilus TaxID=3119917 RepID=UPI0037284C79
MPIPDQAEDARAAAKRLMRGMPNEIWTYRDAEAQPLFHVVRRDRVGRPKDIRPMSWQRKADGSEGYVIGLQVPKRPLYGLDLLAARPDAGVLIVEGEKCAEAARPLFSDHVVITWCGGASATRRTDWSPLSGRRRVTIFPDADEPGDAAAMGLINELTLAEVETIQLVNARAVAAMAPEGGERSAPKGWDIADAAAEWQDIAALKSLIALHTSAARQNRLMRSFGRFKMGAEGLFATVVHGTGEKATEEEVLVCGPFEIIGRCRDPDGNGRGRLVRWRDEDSRERTEIVLDSQVHGEPRLLCQHLADKGLWIATGHGAASLLADYLNRTKIHETATVVARTGWQRVRDTLCFVLGDRTIGEPTGEKVMAIGGVRAPMEMRGSLEQWRNGVGQLVTGHHRHMFMVSAAFAGPLLHLLGMEGGGINLFGGSSTGKSTALAAAASVYGKGATPGFIRAWRATTNGLEGAAVAHCDTCLPLDELGLGDPREISSATYLLSGGTGKTRASHGGSLRQPAEWRIQILSTGEMPLSAKLAEANQKVMAGQAVRFLDIPADAGKGFGSFDNAGSAASAKDLADAIKAAAQSAYGSAGLSFIDCLIEGGTDTVTREAASQVKKIQRLLAPRGADGQVLRAADRFAVVAVAGEMAIGFGIAPWEQGSAIAAAKTCFDAWLDTRGGTEPYEERAVVSQVCELIERFGDSRFDPLGCDVPERPALNRLGFRREHEGRREWLIPKETWHAEVIKGHDPRLAAKTLVKRNMLRRGRDGNTCHVTVDGRPRRFYVLTDAVLGGGSDDLPE